MKSTGHQQKIIITFIEYLYFYFLNLKVYRSYVVMKFII